MDQPKHCHCTVYDHNATYAISLQTYIVLKFKHKWDIRRTPHAEIINKRAKNFE